MAQLHGFTVRINLDSNEELRKLTPDDCLLQTKEPLMRGMDYSADPDGISLLIARPLPNHRAYVQALGRAGRNG